MNLFWDQCIQLLSKKDLYFLFLQVVRMLVLVVLVFILCWSPLLIYDLLQVRPCTSFFTIYSRLDPIPILLLYNLLRVRAYTSTPPLWSTPNRLSSTPSRKCKNSGFCFYDNFAWSIRNKEILRNLNIIITEMQWGHNSIYVE